MTAIARYLPGAMICMKPALASHRLHGCVNARA